MKKILSIVLTMACGATAVLGKGQAPILFQGQQDTMSFVAYDKIEKDRLVGASSVITGEQLRSSFSPNVQTALSSLSLGLFNGGWQIRGSDAPLLVIDGQRNRSMSSITVEEVENVYVLRDATAKLLYGSEAANGVIMIETKRGAKDQYLSVTGEYGIQMQMYKPEYLNSYEYVQKYNQARKNDGLDALYTDDDIEGYRKVVEGDPDADYVNYPNNDMHEIFMDDKRDYYRANVEFGGSQKDLKYFLNLGYYGDTNMQKVGQRAENNRMNVRTNLNYRVNNIVSVYADAAARWDITMASRLSDSQIYSALSTSRPMEYPMFVGEWGDIDSLGKGDAATANLYGELTRKGYNQTETVFAQTNVGMDFDLNTVTKGLTGRMGVSYDAYSSVAKGQLLTYYRYQPQDDGSLLRTDGPDKISGAESKTSDNIFRNVGLDAQIHYNRTFNQKHAVSATMIANLQSKMNKLTSGTIAGFQDDRAVTAGMRANYAFDNRYVIEGSASYYGSDKFSSSERWKPFGAIGGAWNIHNESFMSDVDFVDKLKVKASYGHMGYDAGYEYALDLSQYNWQRKNQWGGTTNFGIQIGNHGSGSWTPAYVPTSIGNPAYSFEVNEELNVGIEANLFNNRLLVEANYFKVDRTGIPVEVSSLYPDYMGYGGIYPIVNYNAKEKKGYEIGASWGDRYGDFSYRFGAMMLYNREVWTKYEQATQMYDHQYVEGRVTDAISGMLTEGYYQNYADIEAHGVTSSFATLVPGDLKFTDRVADGIINGYDSVVIGNWNPRYSYNFTLNLAYKNFSLYLLGRGAAGADKNLLSATLYKSTGNTKYSTIVNGAAVITDEETGQINADASYPRLSTTGSHSFRSADYWLTSADYFRLKTAQLTYDLPADVTEKLRSEKIQVFMKGENLFGTSAYKSEAGMDPISSNSGVSAAPTYRSVSIGLNWVF